MTFETVSGLEVALLGVASTACVVHARGIWRSVANRRLLAEQGVNGARRLLVTSHIRGHALQFAAHATVIGIALWLMTRGAATTVHSTPVVTVGLLAITTLLLVDSLLDAATRAALERMPRGE